MSHFLLFTSHFNRDKGIDVGRLSLNHLNKGTIDIWQAISATEYKQWKEGFHKKGGMIPPNYRLKNTKLYQVDLIPIELPHIKGVGGNFYRILPFKVTTDKNGERGDFGIHKDASSPGSLGCIVLDKIRFDSFENVIFNTNFGNNRYIPLFVQYS
jgi:hypothetical protein